VTRLAFLTPLPPAGTGIVDYARDVIRSLAGSHEIDVFHHPAAADTGGLPRACRAFAAEEFLSRHRARPFDLAVYQLGNGPDHDFVYDPLARVPGLLVLHDLVLHHARARTFLDAPEVRAYRAEPSRPDLRAAAAGPLAAYRQELAHSYPGRATRLADAQLNTVGRLLPYAYPLFRLPVQASRLTAVHNGFMAGAIRGEAPDTQVALVAHPVQRFEVDAEEVRRTRQRLGLEGAFVVGCFGLLTPEKQVATVARAVARAAVLLPAVRLLLVGPVPHQAALKSRLWELGVLDRTVVTGRVSWAELPVHLEAADLVAHLRYPSAGETSGALLHVLAQGRPAVVSDLANLAEIPAGAVLRADPCDEEGDVFRAILDVAAHPERGRRVGLAARDFAAREHSLERCRETYEAAIGRALNLPDPPPRPRPDHWPPAERSRSRRKE
jgi:glycosyltransferase involved in cell wall biosynthesis